jgi:hypothetical protein
MATNKDGLSPLEQMIAQHQGITEGQYLQMRKALCAMPSRYFPEVQCDACPKELPQDSGEAHYWNDGSEDLRLCSACYAIAEALH